MSTSSPATPGPFDHLDQPTPELIARMRAGFQTERETDELLTRKMQRRSGPPYRRHTLAELTDFLRAMLTHEICETPRRYASPKIQTRSRINTQEPSLQRLNLGNRR